MRLLALDTSTEACSVALRSGSEQHVDHRIVPQQHAQRILPMIDAMLADAGVAPTDLDGVIYGCGPGSFTGVRIAAAVAQGMALGAELGILPVSSLAAIAQGCYRDFGDTWVCAALDARRGEIYLGHYLLGTDGIMQAYVADRLADPDALREVLTEIRKRTALAGSGAERYFDPVLWSASPEACLRPARHPHALDLITLAERAATAGDWLPPESALPVYLRNRVALTHEEQRQGKRL